MAFLENEYEKNTLGSKEAIAVEIGSEVESIDSRDWTDEEEKSLVKKLDLIVMPLLLASFFVLQLDRGNIGNALTDFFFKDVGITQNQFNVGQQLLSLGIVLLEIPSNYILYRIGPTIWIGSQILAWGLVATFQAFQKGYASYMITRVLLGICESGFIPAALYTITRWYKRDETSKRFAWFFAGSMTSSATTGLIAYGVLQMRGVCGLAGWQWLFILEGLLTIAVGILFTALFPRDPANPVSLFKVKYFTEREIHVLVNRVFLDDPSKKQPHKSIPVRDVLRALKNWRVYPHLIITICGLAPAQTLGSYAPTLVASMGYNRLAANAMVSIGSWAQLFVTLFWGFLGDKFQRRGPLVFIGLGLTLAFAIGCRVLIESHDRTKRFALLTMYTAFTYNWHPLHGSWLSLNAENAGERSITLAMFIMSANASGIVGKQIFQQQDAPLYRNGWTIIMSLLCVAFVLSAFANLQYWWLNKRLRQGKREGKVFSL